MKGESANFAAQGGFQGGRGGRGGAGARTVSRTADGGYTVQGYSSRPAMNCYHCKKDGHGWRDCTLHLSTDEGKKWKASDKGKQWTIRGTTSDNIQELASLAITVDKEEESEEVDICLSSTSDNIKSSSWHLDSACSRHLTSEKNVFVGQITKSSAKCLGAWQ